MKSLVNIKEGILRDNWKKAHAELAEEKANLANPKLATLSTRMKVNKLEERINAMERTAEQAGIVLSLEEGNDGS